MSLGTAVRLLSKLPMFRGISLDAMRLIAFGGDERRLRDGQVLFEVGDLAHGAYLVISGEIDLYTPEADGYIGKPQRFTSGAMIGSMCLFVRKQRESKAVSVGDTQLLSIPKRTMERVLKEHPEDAKKFEEYFRGNLMSFAKAVSSYTAS